MVGQCCPSEADVAGGLLVIHWRQPIPESSRVATHICYAMVHLDQPKRCHLQGTYPLGRCNSARREDWLSLGIKAAPVP